MRPRLLSVIKSIDTPVCHCESRRWEAVRADLGPDVEVFSVSMDLPFAMARWQQQEGVTYPCLSAHKSEAFGRDYGVLLKEWRLLQRAVFVIDSADVIRHPEYVADQMKEPDYQKAIDAALACGSAPAAGS